MVPIAISWSGAMKLFFVNQNGMKKRIIVNIKKTVASCDYKTC